MTISWRATSATEEHLDISPRDQGPGGPRLPGGSGGDGPGGSGGAGGPEDPPPNDAGPPGKRPPRPRHLVLRWLVSALVGVLVLCVTLAGAIGVAGISERGTRLLWQAAVMASGGKLAGTLDGGTLAGGLRLRNVSWGAPGSEGMTLRIDRLTGRWSVTRSPWHLTIDTLHAGNIVLHLPPSSTPPAPATLPTDLTLPLALTIRDLGFDSLEIDDAGSVSRYADLQLEGQSDGRHHVLTVDRIDTPFGHISANAGLDGMRPFALDGMVDYGGRVADEAVSAHAVVSGSLAALVAELDATGAKLTGHAHVEAAPFAEVPLTRADLRFDHINPAALSPGAPRADLAVRAALLPVPGQKELAVSGPVSIVNAAPGLPDAGALPLIDAQAQVRLDAAAQHIDGLTVRLLRGTRLTGGGNLSHGTGRFDFTLAGFDPTLFTSALRPMQLGGPIALALKPGQQTLTLNLADTGRAHALEARIALTPKQTSIEALRIGSGAGRVEATGSLGHDARSSYKLDAKFVAFDPLAWAALGNANQKAGAPGQGSASVTGAVAASGALSGNVSTQAAFHLIDSTYDGLPMSGDGRVELAGKRLLPSTVQLSVAGNQAHLDGSFGAPGDRLNFTVEAPQLDRLGFGVGGQLDTHGELSGSFAHPQVDADYKAQGLVVGTNRIGAAQGQAHLGDGLNGALDVSLSASQVALGAIAFDTLSAKLAGTRARHSLEAHAQGAYAGHALDLAVAAAGGLKQGAGGQSWQGTLTRLSNQGQFAFALESPLAVSAGAQRVTLGAARMNLLGAALDLRSFDFANGAMRSAGTLAHFSVARAFELSQALGGDKAPLRTDLVLNGDWDFALGPQATGYIALARTSGDMTLDSGRGSSALGVTALAARAAFGAGNRLQVDAQFSANRIGTLSATLGMPFAMRDGVFGPVEDGALAGRVDADLPSLTTTGHLFGPNYLLDGRAALHLNVAGSPAHPQFSGKLTGDDLSATLVDLGAQLKDGVLRVSLANNQVSFDQVEFKGGQGTLRMLGRVRLDGSTQDLTASMVADRLELFTAPDRQLMLSGKATVGNDSTGALTIGGKFTVDHARFDLPEEAAPHLSDDVAIVGPDSTTRGAGETGTAIAKPSAPAAQPASSLAPRADVAIDLGRDFRFRGQGADLGLRGTIALTSAPGVPLRAVGEVVATPGSTYTAFGRKLAIENGFFTFNGPVTNPGINILAMRRNQEVEAGVQVTGTADAPVAKLVSEPSVADNEKLSWLLFGHGTDTAGNLGQQGAVNAALGLLGSVTGKRVAHTIGVDEFTIGQSEVGLTDPQVVLVSKAINERLVFGYEQGLQSASNAFKATLNLTRFWSVSAYTGTFDGVDLGYTRRFDHWW